MPHYRIYELNHLGKISSASDAECANDSEALAQAEAVLGEEAHYEIWHGARRVSQRFGQQPALPVEMLQEAPVVRCKAAPFRGRELDRSIIDALASARAAGDIEVVDGLMRAWRALLSGRGRAASGDHIAKLSAQFRVVTLSGGSWTIEWTVGGVVVGPECGDFRTEAEAARIAHELTVMDFELARPV